MDSIQWTLAPYDDLSLDDLYDLIQARIEVFVVEQNCPYQDMDGRDRSSLHLWARRVDANGNGKGDVLAYARITLPGVRFPEPSIGRVITTEKGRGQGLGRALMVRAIEAIESRYSGAPIRISAQRYLEKFYSSLGFETVSEPYLEDNIPHVEMLRSTKQ